MSIEQLVATVRTFDGVLVLAPDSTSGFPEIAWGDYFFYYAPDGEVPQNEQPFATIVTKDYPDDAMSVLDADGRFRVNIHVGGALFEELTGESPRAFAASEPGAHDFSAVDQVLPHPVYGALGWVSVVTPSEAVTDRVVELLQVAHAAAVARATRRSS